MHALFHWYNNYNYNYNKLINCLINWLIKEFTKANHGAPPEQESAAVAVRLRSHTQAWLAARLHRHHFGIGHVGCGAGLLTSLVKSSTRITCLMIRGRMVHSRLASISSSKSIGDTFQSRSSSVSTFIVHASSAVWALGSWCTAGFTHASTRLWWCRGGALVARAYRMSPCMGRALLVRFPGAVCQPLVVG